MLTADLAFCLVFISTPGWEWDSLMLQRTGFLAADLSDVIDLANGSTYHKAEL